MSRAKDDSPESGAERLGGAAAKAERMDGISLMSLLGADRETLTAAWQDFLGGVAQEPKAVVTAQEQLVRDVWQIWFGGEAETDRDPAPIARDPRFEDAAWSSHPWFKRMRDSYYAWCRSLDVWLSEAKLDGLERRQAEFLIDAAKDVFCPVNSPFTPETISKARETGGQSLVQGFTNYLSDLRDNHGYPAIADREAFKIGQHVAASAGSVVFRNELLEVIQYQPTTELVHRTPLLYVFSQVNRFYLGDLTPDRSLFKQLLDAGIQVFAVSWKNPTLEHAQWDLDTYAEGVIQALTVVRSITKRKRVDLMGLCAGGVTTTAAAAALSARADNWLRSMSLFVSIIDNQPGDSDFTLFATDESVAAQKARVRAQGLMTERDILEMFAMLRLDESIFSFVRSNYYRGEDPLAHPLLFWSMDYTRVPAGMQCDLIDLGHTNGLAESSMSVLGYPANLGKIKYPIYIMAGSTDHITPWKGCYRSTQLFGTKEADLTFVLTAQNHTQTISARPDNRHLRYWLGSPCPEDADEWLEAAEEHSGNWRDHWIAWLQAHSQTKKAPRKLGSKHYPVLGPAPGRYVLE